MAQLELVIDRLSNDLAQARLLSSTQTGVKSFKPFVAGDRLSLSLTVVDVRDGEANVVDMSGYSIRCGIGNLNAMPSGGTFTLTYGANTTPALAYNASAAAVETALNALASVTSAGGLAVSGIAGGPWFVLFTSNGSRTSIGVGASGLTPQSGGIVSELTAGDGSTREEQLIRLYAQPFAYLSSFTFTDGVAFGTLNLNTRGIYDQLGHGSSFNSKFEIEITDTVGNVSTILQAPIVVNGDAINATTVGTPDFDTYLTSAAAAATYLPLTRALFADANVTGLTGGGSSNLDGLVTASAGYVVNSCILIVVSGAMQFWRLETGTDAEDSALGIVRPDDYAGTTNEKIWKRIG